MSQVRILSFRPKKGLSQVWKTFPNHRQTTQKTLAIRDGLQVFFVILSQRNFSKNQFETASHLLFQFSQFCGVCDYDQGAFRIKHLLGIDVYVDLITFLDSHDIETIFFTEI